MPLIQSKKYGTEQYVTVETWQWFSDTDRAKHFKVIDDEDMQKTVIERPHAFEPIEGSGEVIKPYEGITVSELKEELDDYPAGATKKELYELYISK